MIPLFFLQKSATIRPVQCRKSLWTRALGVATVIGLLLASTAEAVTRLQANRYTEVDFKGRPFMPHLHRPSEEFVFTVPDNSVATLRVTELGCPGNVFSVDISDVTIGGTDFRFRTSSVPFRIFCRRPLHIDQASNAFTNPSYSKGSVELPAGTYIVQITPHSKFATSAAIGFFPSAASTAGVSTSLPTSLGTTATTVVETTISESTIQPETTISSISEPTTTFSEPETTSETSDTNTVESGTSTAVASETSTVVIPSISGDTTETTTSEGPTPTDISTSPTAGPSSATEPGTAITSDITTFSEPRPTASEASDTATVESDTSTAVASETSAVVSTLTSGETTETITSEGPTPTDTTASPTAGSGSTTETGSTATTTDEATSTHSVPTPLATCNGESRYLSLVTSPAYLFNDAEEACGVNYKMAKISTFKEIKDAGNVLKACGVQSAWIKVESANMLEPPKCYAINLDKLYEPADCEQQVMQVLCATP